MSDENRHEISVWLQLEEENYDEMQIESSSRSTDRTPNWLVVAATIAVAVLLLVVATVLMLPSPLRIEVSRAPSPSFSSEEHNVFSHPSPSSLTDSDTFSPSSLSNSAPPSSSPTNNAVFVVTTTPTSSTNSSTSKSPEKANGACSWLYTDNPNKYVEWPNSTHSSGSTVKGNLEPGDCYTISRRVQSTRIRRSSMNYPTKCCELFSREYQYHNGEGNSTVYYRVVEISIVKDCAFLDTPITCTVKVDDETMCDPCQYDPVTRNVTLHCSKRQDIFATGNETLFMWSTFQLEQQGDQDYPRLAYDDKRCQHPAWKPFPASQAPSTAPSLRPTTTPSITPSDSPSIEPSTAPSITTTRVPSGPPSLTPTTEPSTAPSVAPSWNSTTVPT